MANPTHDDQIEHYLRCALNVAHAKAVDKLCHSPWGLVFDRLRYLMCAHRQLPFTEPSALYGRKHGDPARGEEAGAAGDLLVESVEDAGTGGLGK